MTTRFDWHLRFVHLVHDLLFTWSVIPTASRPPSEVTLGGDGLLDTRLRLRMTSRPRSVVYGALHTPNGEGFAPQAYPASALGARDLLVNIAYFGGKR